MGICVIVDAANDRVLGHCHGNAKRDGVPVVCGVDDGCALAGAGQVRRHYAGTKDEFIADMIANSTTCTNWGEMDGASYDGTNFGELALLPRT